MTCPEILNFLNSVSTKIDLPLISNSIGDVRTVRDSGIQYYWSGSNWIPINSVEVTSSPAPASSIVSETSFDQIPAVGVSLDYARADHTHGTPPTPSASILLQTKHSFLTVDSSTTSRDPTYTNLMSNTITLANASSKVRVIFTTSFRTSTGMGVQFRILVGATTYARCAAHTRNNSEAGATSVTVDIPSLGVGTHTIQIQYCKEATATAGSTLYIRPATYQNIEHASLMLSEVTN